MCERMEKKMLIRFDRTGVERKALVTAISEITGDKARYMGAPSFAYRVDGHTITKDGTLETGGLGDVPSLLTALEERGFVPAEAPELPAGDTGEPHPLEDVEDDPHDTADTPEFPDTDVVEQVGNTADGDAPDVMVIELPDDGFSEQSFENLTRLVAGKAELIRKAAGDCLAEGANLLPIAREEGKICFPWFRFGMEPDEVTAWSQFVCALGATAKKQKRVILKEKKLEDGASEKFAMRCFLLKLGFIGEEYKTARKVILAGLPGDGSHKRNKKDVAPDKADDLAEALADAELIHDVNALFETEGGADADSRGDCLSCGQSMSEPCEDGAGHDKLFCTEREEYVEEDGVCPAYNN